MNIRFFLNLYVVFICSKYVNIMYPIFRMELFKIFVNEIHFSYIIPINNIFYIILSVCGLHNQNIVLFKHAEHALYKE